MLVLGAANVMLAAGVVQALVRIQGLDTNSHTADATLQLRAESLLEPRRGDIIDARGNPMAMTYSTYRLVASPGNLGDEALAQSIDLIARSTGLSVEELNNRIIERNSLYTILAKGLESETASQIQKAVTDGDVGGLQLELEPRRRYPSGPLASHLLGYTDGQNAGRAGTEAYYDDHLRGRPGRVIVDRDPLGRPIPVGRSIVTAAEPGGAIQLTIDRRIQMKVESILRRSLGTYGSNSGSIIVINPNDGAILALANEPHFNPDQMAQYSEIGPEFLNSSVQLVYEPGSTFKLITMAAGLDAGAISPTTIHDFPGQIEYGGREIANWDKLTYPGQNMTSVLQHSSNTGAVWVADRLGPPLFYQYLRAFGIGEATGVDLAGEINGIVRFSDQPGWYPSDLATNSFGQGLAATPLQIASAIGVIANGGTLLRPRVVRSVMNAAGSSRPTRAIPIRRVISTEAAKQLIRMMYSAERAIPNNVAVNRQFDTVGKTATTEIPIESGYSQNSTIPSYVGFGPARAPQALVLVKIDAPVYGRWASEVAAPIFNEIVASVFPMLGIEPMTPLTPAGNGA